MQTIAGCKQKRTNAMDPRMNERAIIIGCMALYALPSIPAGVDAGTAAAFADEKETTCSTRASSPKELFTVCDRYLGGLGRVLVIVVTALQSVTTVTDLTLSVARQDNFARTATHPRTDSTSPGQPPRTQKDRHTQGPRIRPILTHRHAHTSDSHRHPWSQLMGNRTVSPSAPNSMRRRHRKERRPQPRARKSPAGADLGLARRSSSRCARPMPR